MWDIPKIKASQIYTFKVDLQIRQTAGTTTIENRLRATTDQISKTVNSELVAAKILAPTGQ